MYSKKVISTLFIVTVLVYISGCAFNKPEGPIFSKEKNVDNHLALIYVYRPLGESFGYDRTYYLKGENGNITDLKHGGYFPIKVAPGNIALVADVNESIRMGLMLVPYAIEKANRKEAAVLEFQAKAGDTYYVRFKPVPRGWNIDPTLALVSKDESKAELEKCKLIINDSK